MNTSEVEVSAVSRRRFLTLAGSAAALAATRSFVNGTPAWANTCTARIPDRAISIQLWTCFGPSQVSMPAVLATLAAIGYTKVEHAGYGSARDPKTFKSMLDDAGIACTSGHTQIPVPYDDKQWRRVIDDALIVGQKYIVGPSTNASTESEWVTFAKIMNKAGKVAVREGIRAVGFHCHAGEWQPTSDNPKVRPIDILMDVCDPNITYIQMDIGWCYTVTDPAEELRKFPARFRQFHVKDARRWPTQLPVPFAGGGAPVPPSLGEVNFEKVFAAAKETRQPIVEYIVESDSSILTCADTAKLGYDLLKDMEYEYRC